MSMAIASLAWKSFRNRRFATGLAVASISLSVTLLLGVETMREQARTGFLNTVSGIDLVVGSRTGSTHLLLYSVFGVGSPGNNIDWSSYEEIRQLPQVDWSIPLSMGDTHAGFRVLGTDRGFLEHYRFGGERRLTLRDGAWFDHADEVVIGAEVAEILKYRLGDDVVVAHGAGDESFITHDDRPFRVAGILEKSGTPVDRSLLVSLDGFDGMHEDWKTGEDDHDPLRGGHEDRKRDHDGHESDREISAFMLGLKSRAAAISMQRQINRYQAEPLSAILPGVALLELWEIVGLVEMTLLAISAFVVIIGLFSMLIILTASIDERRREMAILRSVGARPGHIFALILSEAFFITLAGIALGCLLLSAIILLGQDWMAQQLGVFITLGLFTANQLLILALVVLLGCLVGLVPGVRVYRYALIDGLSVRV